MPARPFYDPSLSYEDNYRYGPFGAFAQPPAQSVAQSDNRQALSPRSPGAQQIYARDTPSVRGTPTVRETRTAWGAPTVQDAPGVPTGDFLGIPVHSTFGIPAGPLLNARFVSAAFAYGFDLCTYKTVRSHAHPSHPLPNTLAVDVRGDLRVGRYPDDGDPATYSGPGGEQAVPTVVGHLIPAEPDQARAGLADPNQACPDPANRIGAEPDDIRELHPPTTITNSFGVPSMPPSVWQPDMARAVHSAGNCQVLIGSFQGSGAGDAQIADYAHTARLVAETGAPVLEANLSCPNEGTTGLLCFDIDKVEAIVCAIRAAVTDRPLLLKLAYFGDDAALGAWVARLGHRVDGLCVINTLTARVVDPGGGQALPGAGREISGVCGSAIRWAGLSMVRRLAALRDRYGQRFAIIGGGGVITAADEIAYRDAGADAVMSATGAMWNPWLAQDIRHAQGNT